MMLSLARNTVIRTSLVGVFLALCLWPGLLGAQPTNVEVFERLASECVERELPSPLVVDASQARPYIRSAVVSSLLEAGIQVYDAEAGLDTVAVLAVREENPSIHYERYGGIIRRSGSLTLRLSIRDARGRVIADETCRRTFQDDVERSMIARLENPAYPESSAPLPPASWRRRYAEPVILAGATAVTVLLFFSLRSKRSTTE